MTPTDSINPNLTPPLEPQFTSQAQAMQKKEDKSEKDVLIDDDPDFDMATLLKERPDLREAIERFDKSLKVASKDPKDTFNMAKLIACLIDLGQVLQQVATAYADKLTKTTAKMNYYSKQLSQIPVISDGEGIYQGDSTTASNKRATLNQKLANMIEIVKANKGREEDAAKGIQTMLQSMKDAGQSINDFLGSFIDLLRGISQKINR